MSAVASRVWLCAGHGPGSDLDALKAYLMMSIMYDPTQDDDQLISDFLAAYYGALAAPWIRLYMVRSTGQRSQAVPSQQQLQRRDVTWFEDG